MATLKEIFDLWACEMFELLNSSLEPELLLEMNISLCRQMVDPFLDEFTEFTNATGR